MTITFPDPATHERLYYLVAAVLVTAVLAGRLPVIRVFVTALTLAGVVAVLLVSIDQQAGLDPRLARLDSLLRPDQEIVGRETSVPISADGHYWVVVSIDGFKRRMLVDTGATATTLSERTAADAGLGPHAGLLPIVLQTANGAIVARTATVRELRVGDIVARNVKVVVSPGMGDMDVIGMNFLSRLKGWRVEDGTLRLVPHHPQGSRPS